MSKDTRGAVNARQIKAARALLDWSQEQLADVCGLSVATVRKIEAGHISPRNATMSGIRRAVECAGLEFVSPNGVRQRPDEITVYEGADGFLEFFDDVYKTVATTGGEIVIVCASEDPFQRLLGEHHRPRMEKLRAGVNVKCILTENPHNTYCSTYCTYRFLSKHYVDSVPFYIYGDKYAIIIFDAISSSKVTVIQSSAVATAFRRQFYSMWDKATPLSSTFPNPQQLLKAAKPESKPRQK